MAKTLILSAVFALTISVCLGALPREKKKAFLEECEKIHKTGENLDEILDKWLIPTTPEGTCLMMCFANKKGLVDEKGIINHETALPHFEESNPGDPESLAKALKAFAECDKLDYSKFDTCSKGVEVLKCFRKNAKEIGLKH